VHLGVSDVMCAKHSVLQKHDGNLAVAMYNVMMQHDTKYF